MDTSKGLLDFCVFNIRKQLPASEKRGYKRAGTNDQLSETSQVEIDTATEEQLIEWQKSAARTAPTSLTLDQINQWMDNTRSWRQQKIRDDRKYSITDVLKDYPRFLDTPGLVRQ